MRVALILVLVLLAKSARAAFVETDLSTPGDKLVLHDTATGLDWLKSGATAGLSYENIQAGAGDWLASGWRYASLGDVCGLVRGDEFACPGVSSHRDYIGFNGPYDPSPPIQDGFYELAYFVRRYASEYSQGLIGVYGGLNTFLDIGVIANGETLSIRTVESWNEWARTTTRTANLGLPTTIPDAATSTLAGQVLVRQISIPEPTTALLIASGLVGIAARGRRHYRASA